MSDSPSFTIKKRKAPRASTSKLSFGGGDQDQDESTTTLNNPTGGEEGSAVVIRNRGKKTPSGRVKEREGLGARKSSFGGSTSIDMELDSDGPPTVIKRSLSSSTSFASTPKRGLARPNLLTQSSTTSLPPTPNDTIERTPGERSIYSKEYLDELKNSQLVAPKPQMVKEDTREAYDELTMSKFGSNQMDDAASMIPTSNAINQAKQRREELRKTGLSASGNNDGFISLDVGFANKGGDSRLVREEDELGDGDEDLAAYTGSMEKVPLGKKANKEAARKLRGEMGEMIEEVEGDVSEEDEEMRRWEEAQIRRGGDGGKGTRENGKKSGTTKKNYRPAPIPQSTTLPSLSAVTSRLSLSLSTLQSSHSLDAASLSHFTHERQDLDKQESELRTEAEKIEKKSRWFQEFKETVEDWAAFLDEKFPQLEKIEREYLNIQKERYEIVARRRLADDSDDVALFTGSSVPTDMTSLTRRPDPSGEQEEDEPMMGTTNSEELEPRSILRTTRRAERERRYLETSSSTTSSYPDALLDPGYISDSSLTLGDSSDLSIALSTLHESLSSLFQDVKVDDYRDPNLGIRRKFEEWRSEFGEEYKMLYGGLGLVGVWEFWARVEMASWNPFEIEQLPSTPSDLSQYAWHQALSSYGHHSQSTHSEEEEEEPPKEDESTEVLNALVTSVIIPRLVSIAKESYDPLSSKQTVSALKLVDEISYSVERDSPRFEGLIQSFLHRLRVQISISQSLLLAHLERLSLPALSYDPSTFLARQRFLSRQLKLLRTCMRWRRFMRSLRLPLDEGLPASGEGFDELVLRELVGKVMVPLIEVSWSTGGQGEVVANKVLEVLPKDVVNPALRRRLEGQGVR